MVAVSTIHAQKDGVRQAYGFFIDGIADFWIEGYFTSITNLTGTGGGSWIGTTHGARTGRPGLTLPEPIFTQGTDIVKGMLRDSDVTITLQDDESEYLAALFRGEFGGDDRIRLGAAIDPSEDTVAATKLVWGGGSSTAVRDRHVGNEYIDSSGNRRELYITPSAVSGSQPAGLDHPVIGQTVDATLPAVYVSTTPQSFVGRRCAIYRIVYDDVLGVWSSWTNQYNGGGMIWHGTITDRVEYGGAGSFRLKCAGPASWVRKSLGLHFATKRFRARAGLALNSDPGSDETWVGAFPARFGYGDANVSEDYEYNLHTDNRLTSGDDIGTHALQIHNIIRTAVTGADVGGIDSAATNTTTTPGVYTTDATAIIGPSFDPDHGRWVSAQIADLDVGSNGAYSGVIRIALHAKVWAGLGWDIILQKSLGPGAAFVPWEDAINWDGSPVEPPGPGYWFGIFNTLKPGWTDDFNANGWLDADNTGDHRYYYAWWDSTMSVLDPLGKQRVTLGFDKLYAHAQKARPFADGISVNATAVDSMGWFVFEGQLAHPKTEDPLDYLQVARCSWKTETDGSIRQNSDGQTEIYVEEWEDPRVFGFRFRKMGMKDPELGNVKLAAWMVLDGNLTARQLVVLPGYRPHFPEENWRTALRILLSSGTAGAWAWSNNNPDPPTLGANDHGTASEYWGNDLETQDLGLNIEPNRVDEADFIRVAGEGIDGQANLNRFRLASFDPVQCQDVLASIMTTRGWAMRWRKGATGPQFGVFFPYQMLTPEDVDVTLTESDIHGEAGKPLSWVAKQNIRWKAPIDFFKISAGTDPSTGNLTYKTKTKSYDPDARGRGGNVSRSMVGVGMADPTKFNKDETWAKWLNQWTRLHSRQIAWWMSERHFTVKTKRLAGAKANALYPGAIVSLTDQRVIAPDGSYGVTSHVGFVMTCSHFKGGFAEATLLMQSQSPGALRFWAPLAEVTGYDLSATTLTCSSDMAGHGGAQVDADGFTEMDWSTTGGTALGRVIQSEDGGVTWDSGEDVTMDLDSVAGNVITYSNISGTLRPDTKKYLLLQSATDHTATHWPVVRYSISTDETGDYSGNQGQELY